MYPLSSRKARARNRIKMLGRNVRIPPTPAMIPSTISEVSHWAAWTLVRNDRTAPGPQGTLQLSKRESALMEYLIRNAGQVLPRGLILSYIWGPDSEVEDGNLDNYIYFLRRRLKSIGALPRGG